MCLGRRKTFTGNGTEERVHKNTRTRYAYAKRALYFLISNPNPDPNPNFKWYVDGAGARAPLARRAEMIVIGRK